MFTLILEMTNKWYWVERTMVSILFSKILRVIVARLEQSVEYLL